MQFAFLYLFPFSMDVILYILFFVARHSLAEAGYSQGVIASLSLVYGIGYAISAFLMQKLVRPAIAPLQMFCSTALVAILVFILSATSKLGIIRIVFGLVPIVSSLFFVALQSFIRSQSFRDTRPLAATIGIFTFSWSMGFAFAPFIAAVLRQFISWPVIYSITAVFSAGLGILSLFGKNLAKSSTLAQPGENRPAVRSLIGPARVGLLLAWTAFNIFFIYWPVQSAAQGFPTTVKGLVEFCVALMQALSALVLGFYPKDWQRKPAWLLLFGACGILAFICFGFSGSAAGFFAGAAFHGIFTGSAFCYIVYHGMIEPQKAVRRIAVNEACVGASYFIASILAPVFHPSRTSFSQAYFLLAAAIFIGVAAQHLYGRILTAKVPDKNDDI